ncbi:MAG TPA: hypothetical protein VHQ44_08560 [Thermoanaerobaculia bacterium]|nr:hypothetical protein [Thermoanaerobaculia bacterium]
MPRRDTPYLLAAFLVAGVFSVASATPPEQAVPARVTLRGQVVCSNCWGEADRKTTAYGTPADMKCARLCAKDAVPAALAVDEKGTSRLYLLEDGAFKREGSGWLSYIAKRVEIAGTVREEKGTPRLKVDALRPLTGKEK